MPATEEVWRPLRPMHIVFAVSSVLLFAATIWMMVADFDDEWRDYQRTGYKLGAQQLEAKEKALDTAKFESDKQAIEARIAAANEAIAGQHSDVKAAQDEVNRLDGVFALATRDVRFRRAERDKARADLDLKVRDGLVGKQLDPWKAEFVNRQDRVDKMELALQAKQAEFDHAKAKLASLTRGRDEAQAELKKHRAELDRLEKAKEKLDPETGLAKYKFKFMEWPIVEGFNSHLKVSQLWLPDLTINYGGMRDVPRFDRCITCHMNIDRVETGNIPSFPHDPHGLPRDATHAALASTAHGQVKNLPHEGTAKPQAYRHPYSTHPNPELYLTESSPHPMQKFGCTICHEGQGSGTSFQNASHSPNSPDTGEHWHEQHKWSHNHFWEFPMYPQRLAESACVKCHHNIVELGVNPKFGASAPKLYKGYELVRQYGCFGCHEINGYNAGKVIGPDMRLEPQTPEEADRIAGDPTAIAGTMRKVGPGLRHFASKTTPQWAEFWIEEPKRFRPETRMPQFFGLTNQVKLTGGKLNPKTGQMEYPLEHDAAKFQPVEIAGITAFLFGKSESLHLDQWEQGYQPNAERGKLLFSQRGCLACHAHDDEDFKGIKADFGPNLTNLHKKIKGGEEGQKWVYTWIRDPQRHSPRSKMPNLFLEPEGAGANRVDPAADIAAWLLEKGPAEYPSIDQKSSAFTAALDELTKKLLAKVLTEAQVQSTLAPNGTYPKPAAEVKGDEIELVGGPITAEMKLAYIGRRSISRYGCYGCHDIPGYEKARPIGTSLQDWGRKDPTKLALEHIEEYLHHHGEPDGSSTAERVHVLQNEARDGKFKTAAEHEQATSSTYFYEQLLTHGRAGFFWQKLRDPRSYDFRKIETKGYDERLRMPRFPFNEQEIEAIATFVLGLVAEPPAEKYLYRPQGVPKSRIEGEKLLTKYNCTGCHIVELPEVAYRVSPKEFRLALTDGDQWDQDKWTATLDQLRTVDAEKKPKDPALMPFVRGTSPDKLLEVNLMGLDALAEALSKAPASATPQAVDPGKFVEWYEKLEQEAGESGKDRLHRSFSAVLAKLLVADWKPDYYVRAVESLLALKPASADSLAGKPTSAEATVRFHGLVNSKPDPQDPVEDQEFGYDLWNTLKAGDKVLLPGARVLVPVKSMESVKPARGGPFGEWLVEAQMKLSPDNNRFLAWQMSPPPLYQEGKKVQTPWLYQFLKNPGRLRYTTVLRMPRFNMSDDEAEKLANYFSAVDGSEYPYQDIPQREPSYLAAKASELKEFGDYQVESWKLLNEKLCIKCHSVGGQEYQGDPKKDIRGPNLDAVSDRLRSEWTTVWLFKPAWITPYTSMPAPLPQNQKQFENYFQGDGLKQSIAIGDALMNYHRFFEKQGKVGELTAAPAGAPAKKPGEGGGK